MWPWGHLAVGYVLYSLGVRARTRSSPDGWNVLALALGTQFPDLVDKPLAWWFGVLPGGRTLAHSLLVLVPTLLVLWLLARRWGEAPRVTAFGVGWLSHLFGDALVPFLVGSRRELAFLLWPVTPTVVYDSQPGLLWHLANVSLSPGFLAELALGGLVVVLWLVDGRPLLSDLLALVRCRREWAGRSG